MRFTRFTCTLLAVFMLAGCTEMQLASHFYKKMAYEPAPYSAPPVREKRKVGQPYKIDGKTYYPIATSEGYRAKGIASWYGKDFHGKKTANGDRYNMYAMTAAHPTLPLPTWARVTNLENGRSTLVKINDRGPFKRGRLIDLSYRAAQMLDMVDQGTAAVLVEAMPTDGTALRPATFGTQLTSANPPSRKRIIHARKPGTSFTHRISARDDKETGQELRGYQIKTVKNRLNRVDIYVQTGAFANLENASRQKGEVERVYLEGLPIALMETNQEGRILHRVRVGPIDNVELADTILAKLVRKGFNTAIIVVD